MEKENYVGEAVKLSSITEMMTKSSKVVCMAIAGIMLTTGLVGCSLNNTNTESVQKQPEIVKVYPASANLNVYNKTFAQCAELVDAFLLQKGEITKLEASDTGTVKLYTHSAGLSKKHIEVNIKDIKFPLKISQEGDRDRVAVDYEGADFYKNVAYINRADIVSSTIKKDSTSFYSQADGCDPVKTITLKDRHEGVDEDGTPRHAVSYEEAQRLGGKEGVMNRIKSIRNDSRDVNVLIGSPRVAAMKG